MHALSKMTVRANTKDVLSKLRSNRETHAMIVKEAREGYVEKAKLALMARLDDLKSGKIVSLHFSLSPPQDYTKVYDTAINMLEIHQEDTVELDAQQVRNLYMDEWDWRDQFLATNAHYSKMARDISGSFDE